ncbi:MAG TPA: ribosomal protein S18-alanine N-acetyltransferase [Acidimicrobiales bacterium]|nr:ribosomal protein S18-alanine N-acetyltransferase [Acidimicrobiales bacterium]
MAAEPKDPAGITPRDGERDPVDVHLTPMRRRHLRTVLRIETEVYPRPWTINLFVSELGMRTSRSYYVAKVGPTVVGYSGLMLVGEDAHVTTIAVDPAWHRHHIGTRLLMNIARDARERGARHLTLEVRVSNEPAQRMYRRFGFRPAGIRKGYYVETNEDALVMWADDIDQPEYLERLLRIEEGVRGETTVDRLRP